MYKNFLTQNNNLELDYFNKSRSFYNKSKFQSTQCSTQIIILLDKKTNEFIPFQVKCNSWNCEECSSQKAELLRSKLNIISPQEDFSFFLTLTTQPINLQRKDIITKHLTKNKLKIPYKIILNAQITLETSILFKKLNHIMNEYDKSLDLNKIKSRYKYKTKKQAEHKKEKILKTWFQHEVDVQIKKISQKDAVTKVVIKKRIYLKKLSQEEENKFKKQNKYLIEQEYNKIYLKKREELLNDSEFIESKRIWFNEVITRNQDKERSYFLVVEATKNKHPHFHILLNRFIPSYIIEKQLEVESKIYKNIDLKQELKENKFYSKCVNYVLKYFFKSFEGENSTIEFLNNTYKKFRLSYFSKNLYKKYPFLKTKQEPSEEKRFEEVERIQGGLNTSNLTFDPIKYKNPLTKELEYNKFKAKITKSTKNHNYPTISKYVKETIEPLRIPLLKAKQYTQLIQNLESALLLSSSSASLSNKILSTSPPPKKGEDEGAYVLDPTQLLTLNSTLRNKITLCTGDGGSGKTTILEQLNKQYGDKCKITYCCFTAQACSNINKKLNFNEAKTIHKTFNNIFSRSTIKFKHNENNVLNTDILVIDEFTMLDKEIFHNILKALSTKTHILLLGDEKQLSNFKSNSLYYELLKIKDISKIKLEGQYRSNSVILKNIKQIENKESIEEDYEESTIQEITQEVIKDKRKKILCNTNELVKRVNLECLEQDIKQRNIKTLSQYEFKIGDIVMNTKNNYSLDSLANGENLTILSYNKENQTLLAQRHLNNQIIEFPFKDTFYLVPAYAITIHKSQGSEYEEGFILIENVKGILLTNQNILYTACSRFRTNFKLYFLDEKAKNKCYNSNSDELNNDLIEYQKPKELLSELSKIILSNPNFIKNDPSRI